MGELRGKAADGLLERIDLFDDYQGPSIPRGTRSLGLHFTLRAGDRTLSAEDVHQVLDTVSAFLVLHGWSVRTA